MDIETFRAYVSLANFDRPNVLHASISDRPASDDQICSLEEMIGFRLPDDYRMFLTAFGGGEFGYTNVFSADPSSCWFLPKKLAEAKSHLPSLLLPFSDDFAGGYYSLEIRDRALSDNVYYWNLDGGISPTEFGSVLEFIARYAFDPA